MHDKDPLQISLSILLKLTALACALLFPTVPSLGFCPKPDPTVVCEFLNSDAVFVGAVISVRVAPPRSAAELDGWLYELTVQELFRGPRTRTIEVYTENSSGRFPLDVAKKYLLFADKHDGRLTITNCGNSALLTKAQKAIQELHRLEIPKDAAIEGRISFSSFPDLGIHIPGVEVIISGDGGTFKATTDRDGRLHLRVPPGKYSAQVLQIPRWNIAAFDLSYDNPERFDARKGHCSGLQFRADPK